MQCFLVVTTNQPLPDVPERFANSYVILSGQNACVVGDDTATTEEIAKAFGMSGHVSNSCLGMVVKLDHFSGSDIQEIVNKFHDLQKM